VVRSFRIITCHLVKAGLPCSKLTICFGRFGQSQTSGRSISPASSQSAPRPRPRRSFPFSPLKLETKVSVGLCIHGKHHDTGGIHIQPMDDPRLRMGLLRAGLDAVRMLQGFAWNTEQPAWLIDHQKIRIHVENVKERLAWWIINKCGWCTRAHEPVYSGISQKQKARPVPRLPISKPQCAC
jgi:hypothetical protein